MGYNFFTCSACPHGVGEAPEPLPIGNVRLGSFPTLFCASHSSFRLEEGWEVPHYPWWVSNDIPGELLMGRSKWMSKSRSIGVGLRPYGHISKYPR